MGERQLPERELPPIRHAVTRLIQGNHNPAVAEAILAPGNLQRITLAIAAHIARGSRDPNRPRRNKADLYRLSNPHRGD